MESAWATVSFLLWVAVPVGYAILGYRFVRECRAELNRVRSYVDDVYDDLEGLLASQTAGKHRPPEQAGPGNRCRPARLTYGP